MKGFLTKILITVLVLMVIYILIFSIRLLDDEEIGVVEHNESERVVATYSGSINFVWRGSLFWMYDVYTISEKRSLILNVKIPVPSLEELKSDNYAVKIPVNVVYKIDIDQLYDKTILGRHGKDVDAYIAKHIKGSFERLLENYMKPVYNPRMIENKIDTIFEMTSEKLKEELKNIGFSIVQFNRGGIVKLPDMTAVNEGVQFMTELRSIEREYKKQLLKAKNSINREKITNTAYYNKLRKLSVIIRQNPEILKYIYIDKISSNVKVVHSREIVDIFNDSNIEKKRLPLGEIDNLR